MSNQCLSVDTNHCITSQLRKTLLYLLFFTNPPFCNVGKFSLRAGWISTAVRAAAVAVVLPMVVLSGPFRHASVTNGSDNLCLDIHRSFYWPRPALHIRIQRNYRHESTDITRVDSAQAQKQSSRGSWRREEIAGEPSRINEALSSKTSGLSAMTLGKMGEDTGWTNLNFVASAIP